MRQPLSERRRKACGQHRGQGTRGDVLMEYVLLMLLVVLPLVGVSSKLVGVPARTFMIDEAIDGDRFGVIGDAFVELFQMVLCGVCLPLP